jgi:hypothetical protein
MRSPSRAVMIVACMSAAALPAHAQSWPTTKAAVGPFDVTLVKRAAAILSSPEKWNRFDSGRCPRADTTYTVRCAVERAVVEGAGLPWDAKAAPKPSSRDTHTGCAMELSPKDPSGSCGLLWDELPIFTLKRVPDVTSGKWRADENPREVWAGTMADAEQPLDYESRHGVEMVSHRKSNDQLIDFNNDSTTTFDSIRTYFRALEARVLQAGTGDLDQSAEDVEIEVYAGGTGVMRTYNGWFPLSEVSTRGTVMQFKIDTLNQVPPNALDKQILQRASAVIASDGVWNRADNRKCPASASTWSIYCAVEQAELEVTGGVHHRRPAGELVRVIVDERTKDRKYHHRMMDYNNDPATTLDDVRSLFAEAIARIK